METVSTDLVTKILTGLGGIGTTALAVVIAISHFWGEAPASAVDVAVLESKVESMQGELESMQGELKVMQERDAEMLQLLSDIRVSVARIEERTRHLN